MSAEHADQSGRVLSRHHYNSTACFHGQHDECRLVCKFCPEPCRCDCHERRPAPEVKS